MFGRSQPVVFHSYGSRRSRWRLPRWLVLLLAGLAAGAAAVLFVQERYLPPRLSATESTALRAAFDEADAERLRLRKESGDTRKGLLSARSEKQALVDELAASRATTARLRDDIASVVASLPLDPRGGAVAVRAGRFTARAGVLSYDIVLTREQATGKPINGTLQLLVAGESERGAQTTVTAKPIPLSVGSHAVLRGTVPLPDGFRPRQTTIQVLDALAARSIGMRVLQVQ